MKTLFKLFMCLAMLLVALVVIIKVITGNSWQDSVGVLEELWNEIGEV